MGAGTAPGAQKRNGPPPRPPLSLRPGFPETA
jgi:hypothetical protein